MPVVFVNNSQETFTPTQSGAIATWVWEMCAAAEQAGCRPIVVTRASEAELYDWPETVTVRYPSEPKTRIQNFLARADRKLSSQTEIGMRAFADRLIRAIRQHRLDRYPLVLNNDLELSVMLRSAFPQAKIVLHFHNHYSCKRRYFSKLSTCCDAFTAVSRFTGQWVEKQWSLPANSVRTIYNGVNCQRFTPAGSLPDGVPVINFVGRTAHHKGPDLLLSAALLLSERTNQFAIQLVGSNFWDKFVHDKYQQSLVEQIRQLQARNIEVRQTGHLPRNQIPSQLQRCTINTFPSRWDEPFGLATLEGMACGLATVASDTGATHEVMGDAGLLFERENVQQFAGQLSKLIFNRELTRELGLAARRRAEQFAWKTAWDTLCEVVGIHPTGDSVRPAKDHPEKILSRIGDDEFVRAKVQHF